MEEEDNASLDHVDYKQVHRIHRDAVGVVYRNMHFGGQLVECLLRLGYKMVSLILIIAIQSSDKNSGKHTIKN